MKICIYNLTTGIIFGGVEVFTLRLAEELAKCGEEVYLFTGRGNIPIPQTSFKVKRYPYLPHRYIPDLGTRFKKFFSRMSFSIFAFKDLYREKFDIIHIQKPFDLPEATLAGAMTGAKVILGSHGTDFYFGDTFFSRRVDGVFSCSAFNAQEIWTRYRLKAKVIYNGCNTDIFRPKEPDEKLKERFRLGSSPVIATAGRLVNWKRMDILIKALPLLKTKDFRLIVCGSGEYKARLIALSRNLGVQDKIIWPGAIPHEELPRYLSLASVFVQPSISESFGMSICEAMAMGIPVLASLSGGVPEVVDNGINGFLISPGDVEKFAEKIDILLGDRELRLGMGKQARIKVENVFTWEKVTQRVLKGYREVLRR